MDARASSLPPHICHTFATCLPYTSSLKPPQELPSRTAEGDVIIVGDIITVGDVITVDDVIDTRGPGVSFLAWRHRPPHHRKREAPSDKGCGSKRMVSKH